MLACFFFKRVPLLRPQVVFNEIRARDPCMLRWVEIMARIGGGGAKVKFEAPFFHWLSDQILMIEDYAYAGTDFRISIYHYHLALSGVTLVRINTQDVDYVFIFLSFMIFMDDNKT